MSDPSAIAAIRNEKDIEDANEWLHKNGNNIAGIEQKFNGGDSTAYPERTMIVKRNVKRKVKRKDDGPLEIVCGWIVEHQIGMLELPHKIVHSG
jgi:acyl-CoA-dependent ceramide synthase